MHGSFKLKIEARAAPLDSPEAKAGLKARLMTSVESIEDADVRALYRRDLLDRFSAFAFPKREKPPFQPRKQWQREREEPLSPDLRGVKTLKEQLAIHRNQEACMSCHQKIDPMGYAEPLGRLPAPKTPEKSKKCPISGFRGWGGERFLPIPAIGL